MKQYLMPGLCLILGLAVAPSGPTWADAALDNRIRALSLRIEQAPDNQALYLQRALAYADDSQPTPALADIRAAEALGDPVKAAFTHGILLYRAGDTAAAQAYFDRFLAAHPRHQLALEYRARLLRDTGQNRQALADYEALIALDNSLEPGYYIATARLLAALPDRGVDEAVALLDTRLARTGPVTPLQRYAITLEKSRGNYKGAIDRMGSLDQRLKATPQWQLEVADLLLLAGRPAEAAPYLAVAQEQLQSGRQTAINRQLQEQAGFLERRWHKLFPPIRTPSPK